MSAFRGDFLGFTYNNVHSSALGIVRISEGNRHELSLLPTMQDKTVQIPGGDGTYYFGSYFTQRQFTIHFAFDAMTEEQLGLMQTLFGDKKIHSLVFDESPYKEYSAKVTGSSTFKYIPFSEGKTGRMYKGGGTIQFTCYQPYALCRNKDLNYYGDHDNVNEWNDAACLIDLKENDVDILSNTGVINVYNPGVKEADWELVMAFGEDITIPSFEMELENKKIKFDSIEAKKNSTGSYDSTLIFSSKTNLIEGGLLIDGKIQKTGNIYNEFIKAGFFFRIPITVSRMGASKKKNLIQLSFKPAKNEELGYLIEDFCEFNYNYYYY